MTTPVTKDNAGRPCVPCLIDGKPVIQSSQASFPVISAASQGIIHYGQTASINIAVQAVDSAAATFKTYKKTSVVERRRLLLRAADLFEAKLEEAMTRQISETSCDENWARLNTKHMAAASREAAGVLETALTGEMPPSQMGFHQLVYKEAVGPVLLIMPWNGAYALTSRGIASALGAGCTVILKASELCPWTHSLVAETFLEAGFPPGSVNVIMADRSSGPAVTEAVIAHPMLRKIEFIGSAPVGKAVGAVAAKHLKPIVMELGDQSPLIVLDDADLKKAAQMGIRGAMIMHGQVCFATERIIVLNSVKDELYRLLIEAAKATPSAGTAISNAFAAKAKEVIDDAVQRGAKFLYGNSDMAGPASLTPSILTDVDRNCALSVNEGFSPTVFLVGVNTEEEAIAEANCRDGGLSAAVFTGSYERGLNMARELEFGQVVINSLTVHAEPTGPITGWKGSGWGSHGGRYGIEQFLQNKAVAFAPTTEPQGGQVNDYRLD